MKEGCRFWVLLYDLTKDEEKKIYKRHEWTVGQRFYYLEVKGKL